MTDVTRPGRPGGRVTRVVSGFGPGTDASAMWASSRWGLRATGVLGAVAALRVIDWSASLVVAGVLAAVIVGAAAAHLVTAHRALAGPVSARPAGAAMVAAGAGVVLSLSVAPDTVFTPLIALGLALSAVGMARGWQVIDCSLMVVLLVVLAVALVVLGVPPETSPWLRPLVALIPTLPVLLDLSWFWLWGVVQRFEAARSVATELAATRERARIAAELHDVQGHSLHVIAMRAELVERLVHTDPQAAAQHARSVRELAAEALHETRSLVHGYRRGDIAAELRNAAAVLGATGAIVRVHGDPDSLPPDTADAFAPFLREATTNVLRHANPRTVDIHVEHDGRQVIVSVINDGVDDPGATGSTAGGTGVAGLRERFRRHGGRVRSAAADRRDGTGPDPTRWILCGTLPRPPGLDPTER